MAASTLEVTIIVCTYNRGEDLRRTLQSMCELRIPTGLKWELMVVDNNSSDSTQKICLEYQAQLPLQYVFEGQQGKSFALNTGVQKAQGELLLFTDDDVVVDADWLSAMWDAYQRHAGRDFFGGKVLPLWETTPPQWILQHLDKLPVFPHLDWGDKEKKIDALAGELFIGPNIAFPRSVFMESHRFPVNVGLLETDARRGYRVGLEDTEFIRSIAKAGWQGVYVPESIVKHCHMANRYSEKYLRKWYIGSGMALVRLESARVTKHLILGAPRYLWRMLVPSSIQFLFARIFCGANRWLPAECKMALIWGQIIEYRAERRGKGRQSA